MRAPVRGLAVVVPIVAAAACSLVRRGPDLSQGGLELTYRVVSRPERSAQEAVVAQGAARTIDERLKAAGCRAEALAEGSQVRVRLPHACRDVPRLKQLIRAGGRLEFREVSEEESLAAVAARLTPEAGIRLDLQSWSAPDGTSHHERTLRGPIEALERLRAGLAPDALPKDVEALVEPASRPGDQELLRLVRREVPLTGSTVRKAEAYVDPNTNRPEVSVTLTDAGAEAFAALTKRLVGHKLAIVVDGRVNSAPIVMSEIRGGKARITLGGLQDHEAVLTQAKDLAIVLQSGALPELELQSEDVFPHPPAQELKLALEGQQLVARLSSGGLWRLGNPPTPDELAPVITTARAAARRPRVELLVRGAYDVPEPARQAVVRAIAAAGFEMVVCDKDNRNCR